MAVIAATAIGAPGTTTLGVTTLGASDTLEFNTKRNPVLILNNVTAGALTPLIDGAAGTTVPVGGIGNVSVASGYTVPSIAAGAVVAIPLNSIGAYLQGVVTVTGGTGIKASILEF